MVISEVGRSFELDFPKSRPASLRYSVTELGSDIRQYIGISCHMLRKSQCRCFRDLFSNSELGAQTASGSFSDIFREAELKFQATLRLLSLMELNMMPF